MFIVPILKIQLPRFAHLTLSIILLFFLFSEIQAQPLIEWSEGMGGSSNDIPEVVYATDDGHFIVAGQSASSDGSLDNNKGGSDLWVTKLDGDGNLIWEKNYGGSKDDFAMDLQPTADGGFIMTGGSASANGDLTNNNGRLDIWVVKINAQGELLWSKNYGGSSVDIGSSIQPISGGYILAGCTGSAGEPGVSAGYGGNEFWVLGLDLNGNLVWEKTYGGKRHDAAKTIVNNGNGEYLIAGNTWSDDGDISNNHGHSDAWVIKINNVGTLLWQKTFGGNTPDRLNSLAKTNDGNYIFAGVKGEMDLVSNGFYGRYDEQYWIVKLSESGQLIWEKTFGGNKYDEAFLVEATMDGGYIIGGSVQSDLDDFSNNAGNLDAWILKTDANGIEEWSEFFGGAGNENLKSIAETSDGGYVMLAATNSFFIDTTLINNGFFDWWVVKFGGNSIDVNLGNDLTVCEDEMFTLDANVASCNCTYLWNDGSTDAVRILSITSTTNYSVTVTDADGLEGVDQITVFTSQPLINISTVNILCFGNAGGSITLTPAEQNYSYIWSTGSTSIEITNLIAGAYTFTVTDQNGCQKIEVVEVSTPDEIEIEETVQNADCFGNNSGSITTQISGGVGSYDFDWSNGATTPNLSQLSSGTYTLTITDDNFCEKVKEIIVNQDTDINVFSQLTMPSCHDTNDGSINLFTSGGTGDYTFLWNSGAEVEDIDGLENGDYIITITDGNGCEEIQLFSIIAPDSISILSTVFDITCFGENDGIIEAEVIGGNNGFEYFWSNGVNTPIVDSLFEGNYALTVIDINGCEQSETFNLSQPDSLTISIVETNPVDGDDGNIIATPAGGTAPYEFNWNDGMWTDAEISNLPAGVYDLIVTDGNGCIQNVNILLESTSVFEIENLQAVEIFPNPNDGTFFLKLEFEKRETFEVSIVNDLGQTIQKYNRHDNFILEKMDLENLTSGIYFIKIKTENGVIIKKVIIQN
ncbi:MAG: T9SS type A sorting domain-containing protein [Saprospiraceae bacterium]